MVTFVQCRDLCAEKEEYRPAFASAVTPLLGLLESGLPPKPATLTLTQTATQALGLLSECDTNRDSIRYIALSCMHAYFHVRHDIEWRLCVGIAIVSMQHVQIVCLEHVQCNINA